MSSSKGKSELKDAPRGRLATKSAPRVAKLPHHVGHRARLRARFMKGGHEALQDYELLELILFRAIPRRDVKPFAKELIATFGDLSAVLSAPPEQLMEFTQMTPGIIADIKIIEAAALRIGKSKIMHRKALMAWDDLVAYCRVRLSEKQTEEFHIIFLDKRNQIIDVEIISRGTVDQAPVYPREILKRALLLNASSLVLAHNHPSGDPSPSRADIKMTEKIRDVAAEFDITLLDHLVIGRTAEVSFKNFGLL